MKIDLFSIPVFIGNIDVNKLKFKTKHKLQKTWLSETDSNFYHENMLTDESLEYLLKTIVSILNKEIRAEYNISLLQIWRNVYKHKDYQEEHIHPHSQFSFVIYKKVTSSNTVFMASHYFITQYSWNDDDSIYKTKFEPQLKNNQIIIFPSFLTHHVKPLSNSETIAGNLKFEYKC